MQLKTRKVGIVVALLMLIAGHETQAQVASPDTLMKHIQTLSSAQYEGRLAGTEAYNGAAEYVVSTLTSYGVEPYQGEWYQYFNVPCNQIESCTFYTHTKKDSNKKKYILGNDFACAGMTGRGYANAPGVFCGYGIDHESFNEYAAADVKGRVVIVLSGVPNFLSREVTKDYVSILDKANVAYKHGALAMVVINLSATCRSNEVQARIYNGDKPYLAKFPILQVTKDCGSSIMNEERINLDSCMNLLNSKYRPVSYLMEQSLEIDLNTKYNSKAITANVVGILKGNDKAMSREMIVVGAHLDHVGMQGKTCMFPGADDNASGVAAVLETARLLSEIEMDKPKRSVLFVLFSGAEMQHLGSEVFVSNIQPLNRLEAFINAECLGSGDSTAVLGNQRFPLIYGLVDSLDKVHTQCMVHGYETTARGDATAFAQIGIPSLVFSTLNGNKYVHVPSDIAEAIDPKLLTKSTTLMFQTVYELTWGDYQGRSKRSRAYRF